jgi:HTH-type transcriptional regulator/antitoxin HipB
MKTVNGLKIYSHDEIKDEFIGRAGTPKRDKYETNLQMEVLGNMIKDARTKRGLTQEQLGSLVGVQKAQISKLEKSAKNVTFATVMKIFDALNAKLTMKIELGKDLVTAKK